MFVYKWRAADIEYEEDKVGPEHGEQVGHLHPAKHGGPKLGDHNMQQ